MFFDRKGLLQIGKFGQNEPDGPRHQTTGAVNQQTMNRSPIEFILLQSVRMLFYVFEARLQTIYLITKLQGLTQLIIGRYGNDLEIPAECLYQCVHIVPPLPI